MGPRSLRLFFLVFISAVAGGSQAGAQPATNALAGKAAALLAAHCIKCHGPDKQSGGVNLSSRALAISTHAFIPGDTEHSRAAILTAQGKMPVDTVLTDSEKTVIRDWIAGGAAYTREPLQKVDQQNRRPWSFEPVRAHPVPTTRFDALSTNPIDRFIFARLQAAGLKPSAPANRRELIRRVTVDLTGLPPTPHQIDNFDADRSANAYEKVVDRLLASPQYGECWGRHWLDVVRYGESNGYEQNHLRPNAWPYRDYVIRSFNQDKPYNQFVTEQLAGDVVGRGNPDIEPATGFLVAGIHDTVGNETVEGTRQKRANDLDDITSTTGVTFLGVSLNCARCHEHKFDPIPQRDYYRITAVFSDVQHGDRQLSERPLSTEAQARLAALRAEVAQNRSERNGLIEAAKQVLMKVSAGKREPVTAYHNTDTFAPVTTKYVRFTITQTAGGTEPCLDELEIYGPDAGGPNLALASSGSKATASTLLPGYDIHQVAHLNDGMYGNAHSWISNERSTGWAQIELPRASTVSRVVWERDAEKKFTDRVPTGYRIEVSVDGRAWKLVSSSADRSTKPDSFNDAAIRGALSDAQRTELANLDRAGIEIQSQIDALAPVSMAYCGNFGPSEAVHILPQGDVMRPAEQATPGALSEIPGITGDFAVIPATALIARPSLRNALAVQPEVRAAPVSTDANPRLQLAKWICDPRNPLTARVIVNRMWSWHFGHGIVDTPSDFGNMGSLPSHPELLDWLASDLTAGGWKLKRIQKLIVMSYAYRQTSASNPIAAAKDADNRLLWHMPLRRMDAEAVRDSILHVSGKLNLVPAGGPGYRLFKYSVLNVAIYETREDQGPDTWRRSVYQIPARGIRDELLGAFDCPDSSERAASRSSTTTALQALSMLNGKFINEQAGFFADRIQPGGSVESQVWAAFRLAFGREPTSREITMSADLVRKDGLQTLCRALMNANEFLYY